MNRMNPKVDVFLSKAKKRQEEFKKLRMIILNCQLTEELKWGVPCHTFQKSQHPAHQPVMPAEIQESKRRA